MKQNKLSGKMKIISWLMIVVGGISLLSFLYNLVIFFRGYMGLPKLYELFITTPLFLIAGLSFFIPGILFQKRKKSFWFFLWSLEHVY